MTRDQQHDRYLRGIYMQQVGFKARIGYGVWAIYLLFLICGAAAAILQFLGMNRA